MTFDIWVSTRSLCAERLNKLRCKWSYLLRKGLTGEEIAGVLDGLV